MPLVEYMRRHWLQGRPPEVQSYHVGYKVEAVQHGRRQPERPAQQRHLGQRQVLFASQDGPAHVHLMRSAGKETSCQATRRLSHESVGSSRGCDSHMPYAGRLCAAFCCCRPCCACSQLTLCRSWAHLAAGPRALSIVHRPPVDPKHGSISSCMSCWRSRRRCMQMGFPEGSAPTWSSSKSCMQGAHQDQQ